MAITVTFIASVIGPVLVARSAKADIRARVGTPNGRGDVIQMVERIEHQVEVIGERTAALVDSQAGQDRRIARLEARRPRRRWP